MGSEKPKNGNAKLMKPFLNNARSLNPWANFINSKPTRPATTDVVVAMAGMILPKKETKKELQSEKQKKKLKQLCYSRA